MTAGPYWVQENLTRRNVTEGKPGLPLVIRFTVLNAKTCKPIPKADVEIWHCDALGNYSAVNGATTRYLRGHQKAGATGKAEFLTIFPGWYPGRTPHIHMKVSVGGNVVHTGQVFMNEAITRAVYKQKPYSSKGVLRHAARIGHDLQPGRRIDGGAEADEAHRRAEGIPRHDRDRRCDLSPDRGVPVRVGSAFSDRPSSFLLHFGRPRRRPLAVALAQDHGRASRAAWASPQRESFRNVRTNARAVGVGCLPEGDTLRAETVTLCPQATGAAGGRGRRQPVVRSSRPARPAPRRARILRVSSGLVQYPIGRSKLRRSDVDTSP